MTQEQHVLIFIKQQISEKFLEKQQKNVNLKRTHMPPST